MVRWKLILVQQKHRREEEWKAALLEAKQAEDAKRMPPPPRPMGLPLLLQPQPSNVMPPPPSPPSVQVLLQQRPPSPQLLTLNLKGTSHKVAYQEKEGYIVVNAQPKPDMEVTSNKEVFALLADPQPQPGTVQTELLEDKDLWQQCWDVVGSFEELMAELQEVA
jgi:hypothetical protein